MGRIARIVLEKIAVLWCSHEDVRRWTGRRMWVECEKCGRESQGITLRREAGRDSTSAATRAPIASVRRGAVL
jgi:hypothetical protein